MGELPHSAQAVGEAIDTKIIAVLGPGFVAATSENIGIKKLEKHQKNAANCVSGTDDLAAP